MFTFGLGSYLLLAVIVFGAYKVWMGITHILSKTFFHQTEERHVKKISGIVVGVTILMMLAPFLLPTTLHIKEAIGLLYIVYAGTSMYQFYTWYQKHFGKDSSVSTDVKPAVKDDKSDKTGK